MASLRTRTNKSGTSYAVLFAHGGKQTSKTFATLKAAKQFQKVVEALGPDEALRRLAEGNAATGGPTVADLFDEWLTVKRPDMTVEGHRDYVRQYEKWIKPTLGWRDAGLVTERDVQAWVDKVLRAEGNLAPKSVSKQHALLHGMYKWAASKTVGKVPHDPCQETRLPKRVKKPPRGLSIPELHMLLTAGERSGLADAADVIAVMAGTGWRPGEVMGLTAGSVEVASNGDVYATMDSVYRRGEGIVRGGKTQAAGRRLWVVGEGATVLRRRLIGKGINDLMFPHPNPGRGRGNAKDETGRVVSIPWPPSSFSGHYWPKIVKAAGLEERNPTPYSLRHTHVMICHAAGMTLPEIQRRIGHESIQTTLDVYGRQIDGMTDDAAVRLEALLDPRGLTVAAGQVVVRKSAAAIKVRRGTPGALPQTIAGELA